MHGKAEILGFSQKETYEGSNDNSLYLYITFYFTKHCYTSIESSEKLIKILLFSLYKQEADAQRD